MRAVALVSVVMLSACSAQQITKMEIENDPSMAAQPVAYRQGFEEGCQSGVQEGRGWIAGDDFKRDDARMKSDGDYALGWNDGARRCAGRFGGSFMMVPARK